MPRKPKPLPPHLQAFVADSIDQGRAPSSSARYAAAIGAFYRQRAAPEGQAVSADELWAYVRHLAAVNPTTMPLFVAGWAHYVRFAASRGKTYPTIPSREDRERAWREESFTGLEGALTVLAIRVPRAPRVLAGLTWSHVHRTESGFSTLRTDDDEIVVANDATDALDAIRATQGEEARFVLQTRDGRQLSEREIAGLLDWAGAPREADFSGLFALRSP